MADFLAIAGRERTNLKTGNGLGEYGVRKTLPRWAAPRAL
jgi:hypothetical protein